jgi:hypothetical protein
MWLCYSLLLLFVEYTSWVCSQGQNGKHVVVRYGEDTNDVDNNEMKMMPNMYLMQLRKNEFAPNDDQRKVSGKLSWRAWWRKSSELSSWRLKVEK